MSRGILLVAAGLTLLLLPLFGVAGVADLITCTPTGTPTTPTTAAPGPQPTTPIPASETVVIAPPSSSHPTGGPAPTSAGAVPATADPELSLVCRSVAAGGGPPGYVGPAGTVADPTGTGGFVTRRTAHLIVQTRAAFPETGWSCWSPRPGTRSEHPLGRACDVTFGNRIGAVPTPEQRGRGWQMTQWLQDHAQTLGVQYLIWQGRIWSPARAHEGWRPYDGGRVHDPASITGGHYDHLHITVTD